MSEVRMNEREICIRRREAVRLEATVRWMPGKVGEERERKTHVPPIEASYLVTRRRGETNTASISRGVDTPLC
jgi:hypothetical protein